MARKDIVVADEFEGRQYGNIVEEGYSLLEGSVVSIPSRSEVPLEYTMVSKKHGI
jgi:hypothetical protein